MTLLEITKLKREEILKSAEKHGVTNIRIFGSTINGVETIESDIDILVDLKPGYNLLDLGGFLMDMQDLFGRKVHVVTENSLHWYIKEKIIQEAQPL